MKTFLKTLILFIFVISVSCNEEVVYHTAANANFSTDKDTIELGDFIVFTDLSIPAKGAEIIEWHWDFGEDSISVSKEQNPTYTFKSIGSYMVKMTISDSNGRESSNSKLIVVETPYNALAHAEFSMSSARTNLNSLIQFTDLSIPAEGAIITSWFWDFGENETSVSSTQHPTYTYTSTGNFVVSLTVTDSKNNTSSISHDLVVVDPNETINIIWKKVLLGAIENTVSPAMSPDGKTVYMWANQSGTDKYDVALKAFDSETGFEKWAFNVNDALANLNSGGGVRLVYGSPSVGNNGDIYIAARDLKNTGVARKTFLFAIKSNGEQRWAYNFSLDANINYMTPAIDANGNIYVGHLTTAPFEIAVLNPLTGVKEKSIPTHLGIRSGISLDKNGNVFFCSTGANGLLSFTTSGSFTWQYNINFTTTAGSITIDNDGTIYTVADGGNNGGLIAAITTSGTKKWDYRLKGPAQFGGVVLGADATVYANGGRVVPGENSAGIVALNSNGSLKWHYATDEDVNNCVPLVDNRGYVHFITDKGTYYVITDEGVLYGKKNIGTKSFSSPVMNNEGKVFIAAEDENNLSFMYSLETDASGIASSDWPMKGQNPQRTHLQK